MSATVAAALKRIAVSLAMDKKTRTKVICAVLAVVIMFLLPIMALQAVLNNTDFTFDSAMLQTAVSNMSPETVAKLELVENTMTGIETAMQGHGYNSRQIKSAQVLFFLALYDRCEGADFIDKLVGCFAPDQSDEALVGAVNARFGTSVNAEEFTLLMSIAHKQIVEVALSQVGNVGGEPYWSWYGFPIRVEWCACFVSWCADQCGYIDAGIIPKFAGCVQGSQWFKDRDLWQDGSYTPSPGDIIFFDWWEFGSGQDGEPDHVGIVEKVENGYVYTVEGNSGNECRERRYTLGYFEIYGYGTPKYEPTNETAGV